MQMLPFLIMRPPKSDRGHILCVGGLIHYPDGALSTCVYAQEIELFVCKGQKEKFEIGSGRISHV